MPHFYPLWGAYCTGRYILMNIKWVEHTSKASKARQSPANFVWTTCVLPQLWAAWPTRLALNYNMIFLLRRMELDLGSKTSIGAQRGARHRAMGSFRFSVRMYVDASGSACWQIYIEHTCRYFKSLWTVALLRDISFIAYQRLLVNRYV